ncbi:MAG: hypothetical protein GOVbin1709_44 [Prokaryotic dsDNA virus sp.]|nr:MAG: hypothetical protein GOVbin1709_44 [Prokaryotic dsDNA virus sp.]|tara:strand:+ start:2398 stop:2685 length:288 start_codon:yes stop_codon:yes gene_type:complete
MKAEDILNSIQIGHDGAGQADYDILNYEDVLEMIQNYPSARGNACTIDVQKELEATKNELLNERHKATTDIKILEGKIDILTEIIIKLFNNGKGN